MSHFQLSCLKSNFHIYQAYTHAVFLKTYPAVSETKRTLHACLGNLTNYLTIWHAGFGGKGHICLGGLMCCTQSGDLCFVYVRLYSFIKDKVT